MVDIVLLILKGVSEAAGAVTGAASLYEWMKGWLSRKGPVAGPAPPSLPELFRQLGCVTDQHVRDLVEQWARKQGAPPAVRDELVVLLINLVHGVRFHSTHGTPSATFARSADLLEQLLRSLQARRRHGEPVGPGWMSWTLDRFLGKGTFGEVWMGRSPHYPQPRAFKFFTSDEGRDWLRKEKQVLYQIGAKIGAHRNVIQYHNVVTDEGQMPFIVLDYAGGGSLEEWILEKPGRRAPLTVSAIVGGVVAGLAQAHHKAIAHRDLKPANVLLTDGKDARPMIADFGLSTAAADGAAAMAEGVVGTHLYLPPEALEAGVTRKAEQDDVFAVGVIWYQLAVGKLERPPYDFADRLKDAGLDSPSIRLLTRCLAQPSKRFPDTCALEEELERLPPVDDWTVPEGMFDVQHLVREYLATGT